jgi:hypothetical protein
MFTNTIAQRITVGAGAVIAGLAVSAGIFAGTASATDNDEPPHQAGECPVYQHDDKGNEWIVYVPKGTRNGLMYCGADGEWHTGIGIDERSPTGGGTKKPPVTGGGPVVVTDRR